MNLQELVDQAGGKVQLKIIESDRYDRKVAEVFTVLESGEQKLLQEKQLQAGLAMVYRQYLSNCPSKDVLLNVEEVAKQNRVGVWSDPSTVPPWEYRKVQIQQDTVNTNRAGDSISNDLEPDPGPTTESGNRSVSYANISLANRGKASERVMRGKIVQIYLKRGLSYANYRTETLILSLQPCLTRLR